MKWMNDAYLARPRWKTRVTECDDFFTCIIWYVFVTCGDSCLDWSMIPEKLLGALLY